MAAVSLRGVRKTYAGSVAVLHGIDLEVQDGEFLVFVGPSGCGKSTLLRCIAGLEDVSGGEIAIGGRAVQDVPPADRGVAMVFQSYALYPQMTVAQNLGFGLKMAGTPRQEVERQVAEVAEVLQLGALLQRKPGALSGGQRQRVAIGRAIVRRPQVFLFDEPLSNLDASLRVQMRLELARLHQRLGTTMVYVTHDQVEAMTLGQRIAVFNGGRLEQVGTPLDLFERPANRFVAGFLGSPRMNFLPVRPTHAAAVPPGHCEVAVGSGRLLVAREVPAEGELGIRPEDLQVGPPELGLAATVDLVEHLGDVIVAHASAPGLPVPVTVKQPPSGPRLQAGDRIGLQPRPGRVHLFDASGRAV